MTMRDKLIGVTQAFLDHVGPSVAPRLVDAILTTLRDLDYETQLSGASPLLGYNPDREAGSDVAGEVFTAMIDHIRSGK